jgi:hypothetical protein
MYLSGYGKVRDNGIISEYFGIFLSRFVQEVPVMSELAIDGLSLFNDDDLSEDDDGENDFRLLI